jgi:glycosyltransferase involved in cell wall biosynthesis
MACGTPVLGFRRGSVAEIIDDYVTGHVVDTLDQAIRILPETMRLDRRKVRRRFEERFSAARMARDYLDAYQGIAQPARPAIQRDRALRSNVVAIGRRNGLDHYAS